MRTKAKIEPQLATLVGAAPDGDDWLHELKFDGYRVQCRVAGGRAQLFSRNGLDWTERFSGLAAALAALPSKSALLDGEAIVFDASGRSSFQALQAALGHGDAAPRVELALFDCLELDKHDLRGLPLVERKERLRELLARAPAGSPLRYSDHQRGRGAEFFAAACAKGLEGIVSKRADAPYRSGRGTSWLKVKCAHRQELVIAGWTDPKGSRVALGALLLGVYDGEGALRYCGKVGTGFDAATLTRLHARLRRLARSRSALADPPGMSDAHWVEPKLVAEVSFTEWTRDRRVRHPVYLGLREDKAARDVRIEAPAARAARSAPARRR